MTLTDKELQRTYEDCVNQCADSMFRVAYRLTGNRTLAGELVQETYLNAWKGLESLTDPKKMRSWMFAILRNQYTNLLRKESRAAKTTDLIDCIPAREPRESETSDAVQDAIAMLDEKHRMPVLLVAMEGLSVEEAAEVLQVPKGTVLSRLHRGRSKLKELLTRVSITADQEEHHS